MSCDNACFTAFLVAKDWFRSSPFGAGAARASGQIDRSEVNPAHLRRIPAQCAHLRPIQCMFSSVSAVHAAIHFAKFPFCWSARDRPGHARVDQGTAASRQPPTASNFKCAGV